MKPTNSSKFLEELLETGRLRSVKIIDAHTHMGSIYGTSLPASEIEDCVKLMDEENISEIWCAAHGDLFCTDPISVNSVTEKLLQEYPDRIRGYFTFNPNHRERYYDKFDEVLGGKGWIGFKILPNYHNHSLDGEGYEKMLAFAEDSKLAVLCHTWGGLPQNSVKEVANILKRHPKLIFIMGHSAPGECEEAIRLAATYENAYLDLCDIHRHSGIIDRMAAGAGAEKILFGTDLPWYDPAYCIGSVLCARITDEERELIFCQNATRILESVKKKC